MNVEGKIHELEKLGFPYVIACGEKMNHPNVVHRPPRGKFDAINFAASSVPEDAEVVGLNDVDTEIHNLDAALNLFGQKGVSLVFVRVDVKAGPQLRFYSILDAIRKYVPIAASGELMLIQRNLFQSLLPLKPCKAEDSYIMFKVLESKRKAVFCTDCYVTTRRTSEAPQEEEYKRRTVGGIYQALSMSRPPLMVRLFYSVLPFITPLLLVLGRKGYYWSRGILLGYVDYLRGNKESSWVRSYL